MPIRRAEGETMSNVRGKLRNGRVEFDHPLPADWPEGAEVETRLTPTESVVEGMREEDWPTTPEGIALLLKQMEAIEPLDMTPEEVAAFDRALAEQKEWQKGQFDKWASEIEGQFS
jgi:hypothetical protein